MVRAGQAPFGTVEMDDLDRRIMKLLRPNARRSYASIARTVGVSEPTVRNRVDRLVSQGAIFPMANNCRSSTLHGVIWPRESP